MPIGSTLWLPSNKDSLLPRYVRGGPESLRTLGPIRRARLAAGAEREPLLALLSRGVAALSATA